MKFVSGRHHDFSKPGFLRMDANYVRRPIPQLIWKLSSTGDRKWTYDEHDDEATDHGAVSAR